MADQKKPKEKMGYSPFQQWLKDMFMKNKDKAAKKANEIGRKKKKK